MAESADWNGWTTITPQTTERARGHEWVELSHILSPDLPGIDYFPQPCFERIRSMPADPLNLTKIDMVCHFGTHVDAPNHFIPDGPAISEIPLDRLVGTGVIWRLDLAPYQIIEPYDFEQARPRVQPGDIVLLDTGWGDRLLSPAYAQHPSLSGAAAHWLVENRIKLLGVDFPTPDLPTQSRPSGFDWPIHHILLSNGVLIAENLTHMSALSGHRVEVLLLPLRIEGADGAPATVLARPETPPPHGAHNNHTTKEPQP